LPAGGERVLGGDRHGEAEGAALAGDALGPDAAAVQLDQRLGDAEAEASAADPARVRVVHAVEAVPDARQVLGRDADALVGDRDAQELALGVVVRQVGGGGLDDRQRDLAAARRVLGG